MGDVMTYTIACREIGGNCDFVATGATPTEVKRAFSRATLRSGARTCGASCVP